MRLAGAPLGAIYPFPGEENGRKGGGDGWMLTVSPSSEALLASPAYKLRQPMAEEEQNATCTRSRNGEGCLPYNGFARFECLIRSQMEEHP